MREEGQRLRHRGRPGHRAAGGRGADGARPASACTARSSAAPTSIRRWCGCSTRSTARSTTRPGLPTAAILLGLLRDGEPVAGLTWLPFTDQRYTAVVGKPLYVQRRCAATAASRRRWPTRVVGIGTFNVDSPRRASRAATGSRCWSDLSRECSRMRMHGATGIDLAYAAAGILGGAISFGDHVWDHAAGVALVRAAGGIVTDLAGEPWTPSSRRRWRERPACTTRCSRSCSRSGDRRITDESQRRSRSGSFRAWTSTTAGWSRASTSRTCATQAIPSSWPRPTTREGADELTFLDVTASSSGRATMLEVVRRTAEQVFIPLTVGGGVRSVADVDVLLRAGADKVVGQHRGHRAARTARRAVPAVRVAVHRAVGRRPHRAGGLASRRRRAGRSPPTAAGAAPASTPSNGRPAAPSSASGRSCSTRWTPTAPRPASTCRCCGRCAAAVTVPGDRQRRRGRGGTFRARGCCRCRRRAGRQRVPLPGADHRPR